MESVGGFTRNDHNFFTRNGQYIFAYMERWVELEQNVNKNQYFYTAHRQRPTTGEVD